MAREENKTKKKRKVKEIRVFPWPRDRFEDYRNIEEKSNVKNR